MQLQLDRAALVEALDRVQPASGRFLPIHAGVHVQPVDGAVRLSCTNGETTAQSAVDARISGEPAPFVVPVAPFAKIVTKAQAMLIEVEIEGTSLELVAGKMRATLRLLPAADWPRVTTAAGDPVRLTEADVYAIQRVAHAAHPDPQARAGLAVVRLDDGKAIATDSYRMAIADVETGELPAVSIPAGALKSALKEVGVPALMRADDHQVTLAAEDGSVSWTLRLVAETFPDARQRSQLIPKTTCAFNADRRELLAAIERVSPLTSLAHKDARMVRLELDDDRLRIAAKASEVGEISDAIDGTGDAPAVYLSPQLLKDMLSAGIEESVSLGVLDALKPIVMREDGYVEVLMPQRLK